MKNVLESLRSRAVSWFQSGRAASWAENASLEQLGNLPGEVLGIQSETTEVMVPVAPRVQIEAVPSGTKKRRRTIVKHAQFVMSQEQVAMVREEMSSTEPGTPAYNNKRDELCRDHGFTRRQIASAVNGKERAAKRKPRVATEKVAPKPKSARKTSRKK